ncbi:PaaI family thioesterase [Gallibacter intestinalis]|uniref:PaaI family thioesterase n=1 Tax=Gallibacter intestinalis TaxID=2779356 RepID=A0ABR9QWE8_9FIRM|nr:PaaI family thioesterase [Gallibacter intestinalis]MBE5035192.1 PaaI family thioesterase [Gallibacter intestinalis]
MERNPEELKQRLLDSNEFISDNEIKILEFSDDHAKLEMKIDKAVLNGHGIVHGGIIFAMADNAAAAATFTKGRLCVTLSSTINFIRPVVGEKMIVEADAIFAGRTTGVYDVKVTNDQGTLCAKASFTMYFVPENLFAGK